MKHDVIIEIPAGSRIKYEIDHQTGRVKVDRVLFTSMAYPTHYGFFDETLGEDGDPLDALVYMPGYNLLPGVTISVRPIGVLEMEDDAGVDAKLFCVPGDPRFDLYKDLDNIEKPLRDEIQHFFTRYKDLEPGKWVTVKGWKGRLEAEAELQRSIERIASER